jgi:tetratricopeptide (TPR) repeat protein
MPQRSFLIVLVLVCNAAFGQYHSLESQLIRKAENAGSTAARIQALGQLAELYYIYRADHKADSVLQKQLATAEISNDDGMILQVLFNDAISHIEKWSDKETFDRALSFIDKGLIYARELGRRDYEVMAYLRKAAIYRKRAQYENALREISLAFASYSNAFNDSLKLAISLEMGDIAKAKGDAVSAFKNYNNAYDIAYSAHNDKLRSRVYHHYAALYQSLNEADLAKKAFSASLQLNTENKNKEGLVQDYLGLARITDEKLYIDKAISLADSLELTKEKLYSKRIMLAYLMVILKDSRKALDYLNTNQDIRQFYMNQGISNFYYCIGNVYHYSDKADSAILYYKMAEPVMEQTFDKAVKMYLYKEMAECYYKLNDVEHSIEYYDKALTIAKEQNDYGANAGILSRLSVLYSRKGNYKKAYELNQEYIFSKDTLQKLSAQRDLVILELEREKVRHEKDLAKLVEENNRRTNLQYMGISIAITMVFIFIIIMGMFPISRIWFRILSFFSFICLFEFIILLIDSWVHRALHGDALNIWLFKIVLLAVLLPLHHYLEHVMVNFLSSKKLLKIREKFSLKNFHAKVNKPVTAETETTT